MVINSALEPSSVSINCLEEFAVIDSDLPALSERVFPQKKTFFKAIFVRVFPVVLFALGSFVVWKVCVKVLFVIKGQKVLETYFS